MRIVPEKPRPYIIFVQVANNIKLFLDKNYAQILDNLTRLKIKHF